MEEWAKLIEAIGGLITGLAWPVAVVLAVWLIMRRHRDAFDRLIDRINSLQFPGGQIDLSAREEAQQTHVAELTRAVSTEPDPEERQQVAAKLAAEAEELGKIREVGRLNGLLALPRRAKGMSHWRVNADGTAELVIPEEPWVVRAYETHAASRPDENPPTVDDGSPSASPLP